MAGSGLGKLDGPDRRIGGWVSGRVSSDFSLQRPSSLSEGLKATHAAMRVSCLSSREDATSVNTGTPARAAGGAPRPNRLAGSVYASVSTVALDLNRAYLDGADGRFGVPGTL
jgi:hypothetical protein